MSIILMIFIIDIQVVLINKNKLQCATYTSTTLIHGKVFDFENLLTALQQVVHLTELNREMFPVNAIIRKVIVNKSLL